MYSKFNSRCMKLNFRKQYHNACVLMMTLLFFSIQIAHAQQQAYIPDPDPLVQQRLADWQDMKFGLLMHWGPYSQWGVVESWSICPEDLSWASGARLQRSNGADYAQYRKDYEALQKTFNPINFDPAKWAEAAAFAGMRYVVFTTKHHDGFCMFDTRTTDYKITDDKTPYHTQPNADVTRAIFDAFRKKNFWIGAYFSKPDWHADGYWWNRFPPADRNPNYAIDKHPEQWQKYVQHTHEQINELTSNYGKLDILWLDGGWVAKKTSDELKAEMQAEYEGSRWARNPQSQDINMPLLVKNARQKQPGLIVVDRAVPGVYQNYLTPEQHIPDEGLPYPWETCMTMSRSWSYTPNDVYKPTNELVEKLVDIVSKGGNYLLNIGPDDKGQWNDTAYSRLRDIGNWMAVNQSAIYGTKMYAHFAQGDSIRFTQSKDGKTRYVYLFNYAKGSLHLADIKLQKTDAVRLLGYEKALIWKDEANGVAIQLPEAGMNASQHVWVLQIRSL